MLLMVEKQLAKENVMQYIDVREHTRKVIKRQ